MRIEAFLQQNPVFQANRIARRMDASLNLILQSEEVTLLEALVLAAIFFEKRGQIKPSALAEAFQMTRGNVSHCISSLEAKGLVQRQIDHDDARAVQLVLRPLGRRRAVRVVGILDRMQRRFEDGLGAQKLETMLTQMAAVEELCTRMAAAGR
ncbi:MarR family winged helix-turn-helix transcriptional regulator [Tunturiibacter lichenicola]|jgi:DNA-binding MarR family transcriptional regulator|uniref:MarR family winged helix-turn-helix transcriptional regulator n=1 Tax=Tunturiibacter lichenicola TaxID=2051959 RepID=UPI003D9B84D7